MSDRQPVSAPAARVDRRVLPAPLPEEADIFHRLRAPTQTMKTAVAQRRSQTVHGLPFGHHWGGAGLYPLVKAFAGPLKQRAEGVAFTSPVRPNVIFPGGLRYWQMEGSTYTARERELLRIVDDRAILTVEMPSGSTCYSCGKKGSTP